MMWEIILLVIGLVLLWQGSDIAIGAAKKIGDKYGISHIFIGLTVVSIGSSLPEIFTIVYSGFQVRLGNDASGLAIGTTIGSHIAQITLILGITALVGTMYAQKETIKRDGVMLFVAIFGMFLAGLDGRIAPWEGILMASIYVVYIVTLVRGAKLMESYKNEKKMKERSKIKTWLQFLIVALGLFMVIFGSKLVVDSGIFIAKNTGLSQYVIGIFMVGVGTSLPELSIAISAIRNKAEGISLGSLLGSNITDPLFSLGVGASIAGFTVESRILYFDIPFWFAATGLALLLILRNRRIGKEERKEGIILISVYLLYVILKLMVFS